MCVLPKIGILNEIFQSKSITGAKTYVFNIMTTPNTDSFLLLRINPVDTLSRENIGKPTSEKSKHRRGIFKLCFLFIPN